MSKRKYGPRKLPAELRIFWHESRNDEPFLSINESPEDAFLSAEGKSDEVEVGVYELKRRVRLKFRIDEHEL